MDERREPETCCTVLFVDDEPQILGGLRDALWRYPFAILTATSGTEALRLLETTTVDVVVSDERMPNMAGSEFLGIVRRMYPQTVRIVLTGQASLGAAIRAINEGEVHRFLTKPCSSVDLAVTIQRALQSRGEADERARLSVRTRENDKILRDLEEDYPGISEVKRNTRGEIVLDELINVDDLTLEREKR